MFRFSACVVAIYKESEQRQISPLGLQVKYTSNPSVPLVLNIFTPVSYFCTRISDIQKFLDSIIVRKLSVMIMGNNELLQGFKKYATEQAANKYLSERYPSKPTQGLPSWAAGMTTGINAGINRMSPEAYKYVSNELDAVKKQPVSFSPSTGVSGLPSSLRGQISPWVRALTGSPSASPNPTLSLMEGAKRIAATEAANRMVTDAFKGNFKQPIQAPNMSGGTGLGAGTVPIVLGTRDGVTADPTQSDQYRAELSRYMNTVAGPSKEQLGLQMWAQANPGLAAKLKPGQSGYDQSADYFNNRYRDYGDMPSTGAIGTSPLNQMPLEGQQPVQMAQPEMEGVAPESTNERVQNFLRMLTEVGQGQ